jgi:phage shock protein PspC (stress-responsive transcriptional regulator)
MCFGFGPPVIRVLMVFIVLFMFLVLLMVVVQLVWWAVW